MIDKTDRTRALDIVRALRRHDYRDAGYVDHLNDFNETAEISIHALPGNAKAPRLNISRAHRYIEHNDKVRNVPVDKILAVYLSMLEGVPAVGDDGTQDQVAGLLQARRDLERRNCRGPKAPRVTGRWSPYHWSCMTYTLKTPDRVLCIQHPENLGPDTWYLQVDQYNLRRLQKRGSRQCRSHNAGAENREFLASFCEVRGGSGDLDEVIDAFAHLWHKLYRAPSKRHGR